LSEKSIALLQELIKKSISSGADAADAIWAQNNSLSVTCRFGKLDEIQRSDESIIGLRVFDGHRQAIVSSSDSSPEIFQNLVDQALEMARSVPEDEYIGLAPSDQLTSRLSNIDSCDPNDVSTDQLIEAARECEDSALSVKGVTNSEGGQANWGRSKTAIVASNGFKKTFENTGGSYSVSVIAGELSSGMQTDYDYTLAVYSEDLKNPSTLGTNAAQRAIKKLGARKIKSGKFPVVFEPRVARGLVGHFISAINGNLVAKKTTFLNDCLEKNIFNKDVNINEDPHKPRGLRSKPCDSEGIENKSRRLIDSGKLTTWLLDLRSARKLGLPPTGHAARSISSPPHPAATNVFLCNGSVTPQDLINEIKQGLYVTETFGHGVNMVTGDYSRGVSGFWIEKGEITFPVNEITIAGNLKEIFMGLTAANDLEKAYGIDSPTILIETMSIAGS